VRSTCHMACMCVYACVRACACMCVCARAYLLLQLLQLVAALCVRACDLCVHVMCVCMCVRTPTCCCSCSSSSPLSITACTPGIESSESPSSSSDTCNGTKRQLQNNGKHRRVADIYCFLALHMLCNGPSRPRPVTTSNGSSHPRPRAGCNPRSAPRRSI